MADHSDAILGGFLFQVPHIGETDRLARFAFEDVEFGLTQDEPLVDKSPERLRRADISQVKQHLVPKPGIEQVQHGMLDAADVQVHRHPVGFLLRIGKALVIVRINETQVVPARASPLRHGVGLALGTYARRGDVHPIGHLAQRRLGVPVGLKSAISGSVTGSSDSSTA